MMNNKNIILDHMTIDNNSDRACFKNNPKFREFTNGYRYTSAPNTVECMGHSFIAEVCYRDTSIDMIELVPVIHGVTSPNYPDEDYQALKWEYCKKILENHYGSEGILQTRSYGEFFGYRFPNYTIATAKITGGQAQYTGGDIIITFRSEIRR